MMIEKIVIKHLSNTLGIPVYGERPEKPEDEFILIEKVGSRRRNFVDRSTIAIQSYAPSLLAAAELNDRVKDAMDQLVENDGVSRCRLNTDHNFTDTETKSYRYQAVYDITHD